MSGPVGPTIQRNKYPSFDVALGYFFSNFFLWVFKCSFDYYICTLDKYELSNTVRTDWSLQLALNSLCLFLNTERERERERERFSSKIRDSHLKSHSLHNGKRERCRLFARVGLE